MDPALLMVLMLIAIGAGIVGALFGLGGGIIFIPVLTVIFGLDAAEAVGELIPTVVLVRGGERGAAHHVDRRADDVSLLAAEGDVQVLDRQQHARNYFSAAAAQAALAASADSFVSM